MWAQEKSESLKYQFKEKEVGFFIFSKQSLDNLRNFDMKLQSKLSLVFIAEIIHLHLYKKEHTWARESFGVGRVGWYPIYPLQKELNRFLKIDLRTFFV